MSIISTGLTFVAFMAGGILTLKVAWNLDGGDE
jgi:hypothetical protein